MGALIGKLLRAALLSDDDDSTIIYLAIKVIVFLIDGLGGLLLFFFPILLLICLPIILFGGVKPADTAKNIDLVAIYKTVPNDVRNELDSWINNAKSNNSSSDVIEVNDAYSVDFNLLMCIDAVRYSQDFKKVNRQSIYNLCTSLFDKNISQTSITVKESYRDYKLDVNGNKIKDAAGNYIMDTFYRDVTKTKTIISITMKNMDQILSLYSLDAEQVLFMYNNSATYSEGLFFEELPFEEIQNRKANAPVVNATRQQVVDTAFTLLGKVKYFWGGKSPAGWNNEWGKMYLVTAPGSSTTGTYREFGLDCSGYVDWVYKTANVGTMFSGGGTAYQWNQSYPIQPYDLKPGDLAFQNSPSIPGINHVGIFVGYESNGKMRFIHCASQDDTVVCNSWQGFKHFRRAYVKFQGD